MTDSALLYVTMADGSRHFASFPEKRSWRALQRHVAQLPGATLGDSITDGITEAWVDFRFQGHDFTINNPFGEYWFFVRDPSCAEAILHRVVDHCRPFFSERSIVASVVDTVRDAWTSLRSAPPARHD